MYSEAPLNEAQILAFIERKRSEFERPSRSGTVHQPGVVNRLLCNSLLSWRNGFLLRKNTQNADILLEYARNFARERIFEYRFPEPDQDIRLFIRDNPGAFLLLREKHGDRYIDVSTPDKATRAAVRIVSERLREGWYWEETPADIIPGQNDLFKQPWVSQEDKIREWLGMAEDPVQEYLAGYNIFLFLKTRDDHEYEGFEVNWLETL